LAKIQKYKDRKIRITDQNLSKQNSGTQRPLPISDY